ncbi:hypothetical protein SNE40_006559 [Patella caerulea]|uniref:Uncharacterized protein n=1 Tax=Patella caerulea TaxID=87958 RepID=A0AAN8JWF5_PATCE
MAYVIKNIKYMYTRLTRCRRCLASLLGEEVLILNKIEKNRISDDVIPAYVFAGFCVGSIGVVVGRYCNYGIWFFVPYIDPNSATRIIAGVDEMVESFMSSLIWALMFKHTQWLLWTYFFEERQKIDELIAMKKRLQVINSTLDEDFECRDNLKSLLNTGFQEGKLALKSGSRIELVSLIQPADDKPSVLLKGSPAVSPILKGTLAVKHILKRPPAIKHILKGPLGVKHISKGSSVGVASSSDATANSEALKGNSIVADVFTGTSSVADVLQKASGIDVASVLNETPSAIEGVLSETPPAIEGLLNEAPSAIEGVLKGASSMEGVLKVTSAMERKLKGASAMEGMLKGASGMEGMLKGALAMEGMLKGASGMEGMSKDASAMEGVLKGASAMEGTLKGATSSIELKDASVGSDIAKDQSPVLDKLLSPVTLPRDVYETVNKIQDVKKDEVHELAKELKMLIDVFKKSEQALSMALSVL